jgi:hypothetical protein
MIPPPAVIGAYAVLGVLDEGGERRTFRVSHPILGSELVLELGSDPVAEGSAERERLVAAGRRLADLVHPYLARVYDLGFHDGRPLAVTEYVRGPDLEQYARRQRFTPRAAAILVAKLARGLGAAHRRGIFYPGLTPQDVRIDDRGEPRIGGLAWRGHVSAGKGGDPRADVFALGSVLFFLLTAVPAVDPQSAPEALRNAGAPGGLRAICLKALAQDPAGRYARPDEMAADIGRFVRRPRMLLLWALAGVLVLLAAATLPLLAALAERLYSPAPSPATGHVPSP